MSKEAVLYVPAERGQLSNIRKFIEEQAAASSAAPDEIDDLLQAGDEAATNIIVHGYSDGPGEIEIVARHKPGIFMLIFRDEAPSFDPTRVPNPNINLPLEIRPLGGLGVYLIRQCVDEFVHNIRDDGGNELILVKHLQK